MLRCETPVRIQHRVDHGGNFCFGALFLRQPVTRRIAHILRILAAGEARVGPVESPRGRRLVGHARITAQALAWVTRSVRNATLLPDSSATWDKSTTKEQRNTGVKRTWLAPCQHDENVGNVFWSSWLGQPLVELRLATFAEGRDTLA